MNHFHCGLTRTYKTDKDRVHKRAKFILRRITADMSDDEEPLANFVKQSNDEKLEKAVPVSQNLRNPKVHREPYRISTRKVATNYTEVNSSDEEIFEEAEYLPIEENEADIVVKTEFMEIDQNPGLYL